MEEWELSVVLYAHPNAGGSVTLRLEREFLYHTLQDHQVLVREVCREPVDVLLVTTQMPEEHACVPENGYHHLRIDIVGLLMREYSDDFFVNIDFSNFLNDLRDHVIDPKLTPSILKRAYMENAGPLQNAGVFLRGLADEQAHTQRFAYILEMLKRTSVLGIESMLSLAIENSRETHFGTLLYKMLDVGKGGPSPDDRLSLRGLFSSLEPVAGIVCVVTSHR
jgi:hypothetical protein